MRLLLSIFLFLVCFHFSFAQIKGVVIAKETKGPIKSVSVFINNSTNGTITNANGEFELLIPSNDNIYEIVFSCVGFQTQTLSIKGNTSNTNLKIELDIKKTDLDEVEVKSDFEKVSWEEWGKFFTQNFIGINPNAKECEILNPEVIKLKHSKSKNILKATTDTFLVIKNNALGYTISYKLEKFEYQFKAGYLFVAGFPLFEEMKSERKRITVRWGKAREKAYYGSTMHFFRSLFANQLNDEGFYVNKMIKYENYEKKRVQKIYRKTLDSIMKVNNGAVVLQSNGSVFAPGDSANYYEGVLKQKDILEHVYPEGLNANKIAFRNKNNQIICFFKDYLRIEYSKALEDDEYLQAFHLKRSAANQTSTLTLLNENPVELFSNGTYNPPNELLRSGYWSWSDKISTMLPLDYNP